MTCCKKEVVENANNKILDNDQAVVVVSEGLLLAEEFGGHLGQGSEPKLLLQVANLIGKTSIL